MARETGLAAADERDAAVPGTPASSSRQPSWRQPSWARPSWRQPGHVLPAVAVVLVILAGVAVWRWSDAGPAPLTRADVDHAVQSGIQKAQEEQRNVPPDAATAHHRILPSLVTVVATHAAVGHRSGTGSGGGAGESDLGTGVIVNAQGAVLTALHVVQDADRIQLRFADGTRTTASVLRRQPEHDIAVLAPDRLPEVVVPAVLGGGAEVGDAVFPVGNPLGLEDSLTAGVVSALDRSIPTEAGRTLKGLIQFDAAVNPGNSGGPLLDRDGDVVGIVTALANPSRQPYFVGIGFAVPIATASGAAGGPLK
jgi:S1-C subfamily serine protease